MAQAACLDCFCCGKPPPEGGHHSRCPLCAERKMTIIYFCGRKCQAKCWTEHKAWHVKEDALLEDLNAGGVQQQRNREAAERTARTAESTGSEYDRLVAEGSRHLADQNYHKADKTLRKAIALEPGQPTAYYNFERVPAVVLSQCLCGGLVFANVVRGCRGASWFYKYALYCVD